MGSTSRLAGLFPGLRPRIVALVALVILATGCAAVIVLNGQSKAAAQNPYAEYPVLDSAGPSGLTAVASAAEAQAANGPIWFSSEPGVSGPDISSARSVSTDVQGLQIWVAKGYDGGICILGLVPTARTTGPTGPGASCAPSSQLSRGSIIELGFHSGSSSSIIAGVVPSGMASVLLTLTDNSTVTANVADNVYAVTTDGPVSSVAFQRNGETVTTKVGGN